MSSTKKRIVRSGDRHEQCPSSSLGCAASTLSTGSANLCNLRELSLTLRGCAETKSTLLGGLRSPATWGNAGPHSGECEIHGKDGVAGSIPAGGSTPRPTSGNAGQLSSSGSARPAHSGRDVTEGRNSSRLLMSPLISCFAAKRGPPALRRPVAWRLKSTYLRCCRALRPAATLHRGCGCVERSTSGQRKQADDIYVGDDVTIRSARSSHK
jgi:hypothetical protein